jgi:fumarate reductase flavoprotein subunit
MIRLKEVIMTAKKVYGFEKPPKPIPASDIKKTITSDVVVVGGGIAGTAAAMSAAEAGAKPVLIEMTAKLKGPRGDTAVIGSRLQKKLGVEIDRDEVILNLMKYGANKPDQRLIRMWAEGSGQTMDWLLDMYDAYGIKMTIAQFPPPADFDNATEYYPQYLATHRQQTENVNLMLKCLKDNLLKRGVDVYFKTRAKQLLRKGKGRVTGVIAQDADKNYIRFSAKKAVVLCTGDYSNNPEMVAKYCPEVAYLKTMNPRGTGDGHLMAMWVGAVMEPTPHAPNAHGFAGPLGADAFLQVNLKGERFHNEDVPGQSYTNAIERQPGKTAWQVFDAKFPEDIKRMGIGHGKVNELVDEETPQAPGGRMVMVRSLKDVKRIPVVANTIEGLAEKMGVPVVTFKATVARYNELARLGKDLDFGKRPDRLTTIDKPPYYAGKGFYALLVIMSGLYVNTRLQALDKDWEVIPGLYLAGNTVGNRFAVDYPTMVPGISNGMALHHGRVAGLNAATLEP